MTRLLPILSRALSNPGVRVVTYIGDVFEESPVTGRKLADAMGLKGIKLIVLHDTADWNARRDAEVFLDLARRTGGCVLPFDANAAGTVARPAGGRRGVRGGRDGDAGGEERRATGGGAAAGASAAVIGYLLPLPSLLPAARAACARAGRGSACAGVPRLG